MLFVLFKMWNIRLLGLFCLEYLCFNICDCVDIQMLGSAGDFFFIQAVGLAVWKWFWILGFGYLVLDTCFWILGFGFLISDICLWHIQTLGDDGQKNSGHFLCWLPIWEMVQRERGRKPIFHNFVPFTSDHSSQCKFHQTSKTANFILIFKIFLLKTYIFSR